MFAPCFRQLEHVGCFFSVIVEAEVNQLDFRLLRLCIASGDQKGRHEGEHPVSQRGHHAPNDSTEVIREILP